MNVEYLMYLTYVQICDVTCIRTLYVDYLNDVSDDIDDKAVNNHRWEKFEDNWETETTENTDVSKREKKIPQKLYFLREIE